MFQVTTLISATEKLERELIENPPPTEADVEAARVVVKERGEAVAELKSAKASEQDITASLAELANAKLSLSRTVERSRLKPGLRKKDGEVDYSPDVFGRQAFLSVSGQFQAYSLRATLVLLAVCTPLALLSERRTLTPQGILLSSGWLSLS